MVEECFVVANDDSRCPRAATDEEVVRAWLNVLREPGASGAHWSGQAAAASSSNPVQSE
jgi:hypothetical protein